MSKNEIIMTITSKYCSNDIDVLKRILECRIEQYDPKMKEQEMLFVSKMLNIAKENGNELYRVCWFIQRFEELLKRIN